ncbi:MAG TPA: cytochrome c [Polyangiaceae bacterium]
MTGLESSAGLALATIVLALCAACDNKNAFRTPDPTLARMRAQRRVSPYAASSWFPDGRAMREPVADTVPVERLEPENIALETGRTGNGYLDRVPLPLTRELVTHGRQRFEQICATCHGVAGDGVSVVAEKMELRRPPSLHEFRVRNLPPGQVFAEISRGFGLMPSYAGMLDVRDRWAIVAYLPALDLSQSARVSDLPASMRRELVEQAQ